MSFTSTPLGAGRRLDHGTFLGKPPSTGNRPPSPRLVPTSYSYGATSASTRSPPKPVSPARERNNIGDENDSALARFAKIKSREQNSLSNRPGGPKTITSPPHPEKWSVKDTSVNIATAFHQAASDTIPSNMNPNQAWASGASRPNPVVPRSTSVDYEKESQSANNRRLAAPPSRVGGSRNSIRSKPLSKSGGSSRTIVPDSEGEEDAPVQNGRGKSSFEAVKDVGKQVMNNVATFYVRQTSKEPENTSNGHDDSYSYSAEEQEYQAAKKASTLSGHKRGRISTDNKAYKPHLSDLEESDEDFEEDGKTKRRKKKKKEALGGPLSTLPVLSQDKRRKRKKTDSRGNLAAFDEPETDESHSAFEGDSVSQFKGSNHRASAPPRGASVHDEPETSLDVEQNLPSAEEEEISRHASRPGISATLGTLVYHIASSILGALSSLLYIGGRVLGTIFDILLIRPTQMLSAGVAKSLVVGLVLLAAWQLRDPIVAHLPIFSSPSYRAPEVPPGNMAELNSMLLNMQSALSALSTDLERTRTKVDHQSKSHAEVLGKVGALESRMQKDVVKAIDSESQLRETVSKQIDAVKHDVEVLHAELQAVQQHGSGNGKVESSISDEELKAWRKALEERVGTVEGSVKEALELGKMSAKAGQTGTAWYNKVLAGKKPVTIKSSDGQDVTALIGRLVQNSVSLHFKDDLARPDLALLSGGARIIPSLTSATREIRPRGWGSQALGLVTGNGYAIGRPPITALHHDRQNGNCWPMAGPQGQLGIVLAAPAYISDITIDHVAKELAFDVRSAPRQMEVWAMVEGKVNAEKVKLYNEQRAAKRAEALERGETVDVDEYPKTLPKSPQYIRIAAFSYNIHSPDNIQTFPVFPEVQEMKLDFGIVVLRVLNNWGQDEYTCLYRMRVHGELMEAAPPPRPEDYSE
ncbi:hypothetical protein C8J56DRAFT_494408 [Mycena floridula]|nr:hypothetical protein C8J56DRAFT_494408 [Mycena floridula]